MTWTPPDPFVIRWLDAVRATSSLTPRDKAVAKWLAKNIGEGKIVRRTYQQLRNELRLPGHAAGVHLTALSKLGFIGERIRTGPDAGYVLALPLPKPKLRHRGLRTAADHRAANLAADAKWLAKK